MKFLRYMVSAPLRQMAHGRRRSMGMVMVSMANTPQAILRLIVMALEVSRFLK
jgi:hypothetical protein